MTRAEALFTEALFNRWLAAITPASTPGGAAASDVLQPGKPGTHESEQPPISTPDQPYQPPPAGAPLLQHADQVQST